MSVSLLSILAFGLILGVKHAIEPDHVIAVSTIASRSKNFFRTSLLGMFWGIGHTVTLFIIGMFIIAMKGEIPEKWAMSLEFLVGIMLVYLGMITIFSSNPADGHKHQSKDYTYIKSMLIGLVHGLAGSAAMVLLTMSTVNSLLEGAIYILVFGIGTVIGMLVFTTIIGIPFVLSAHKISINHTLIKITGAISTAFGTYYMYNLGVTEGLFRLWIQ